MELEVVMSNLRKAAQQALEALEGWENHDRWVWPESALEQAKRNTTESLAALRAALAQQAEPVGTRALIEECLAAFAEELAAWDIDPPLHHVKQAHDKCEAWLAALAQQAEPVEPVAGVVLNEEGRAALVEHGREEWHCAVRNARRLYPAPRRKP